MKLPSRPVPNPYFLNALAYLGRSVRPSHHRASHRRPQRGLLGIGKDRALAGGAGDNEEVVAVLGEPPGQPDGAIDIESTPRIEGGHHGTSHRTKASDRRHGQSL